MGLETVGHDLSNEQQQMEIMHEDWFELCAQFVLCLESSTMCQWVYKTFAAAAAKSLQSCRTLCDPYTAAHQAPLSLGFSRQEHWSGLPFPSPMQESEK